MKIFEMLIAFIILVSQGWCNPIIPVSDSERPAKTLALSDVPQWHCLRYFKHDIHLMRRCRNHRIPMIRRPMD